MRPYAAIGNQNQGHDRLFVYAATANTEHQSQTLVRAYAARSTAATETHELPLIAYPVRCEGGGEHHARPVVGYGRVLISYYYDQGLSFPKRIAKWGGDIGQLDLLLDSGAFSVWTLGGTVDLSAYIDWCHAYRELNPGATPINLDVIPGTPDGKPPTVAEREAAADRSMLNANVMRQAGLPVIEVYHWHEPLELLQTLLKRRERGVQLGVGGLAGSGSSSAKRAFCDSVFAEVRDTYGWQALPPLHGLGMAPDSPLAARYPWWSIDANSWVYPHRFGQGVTRDGRRGKTAREPRTSQRDFASLSLMRVLDRWRRLEEQYTRMWDERGICYADDMAQAGAT